MNTTRKQKHVGTSSAIADPSQVMYLFLGEQELPRAIAEIVDSHNASGDSLLWDALAYACNQRLIGNKFKVATLMGKFISLCGNEFDTLGFRSAKNELSHISCRFLLQQELKMLAAYALVRSCNSDYQRDYRGE